MRIIYLLNESAGRAERLYADGWYEVAQKGSHKQLRHPTKPGKVTVPVHGNADLALMVIKSIERQSGVSLRSN